MSAAAIESKISMIHRGDTGVTYRPAAAPVEIRDREANCVYDFHGQIGMDRRTLKLPTRDYLPTGTTYRRFPTDHERAARRHLTGTEHPRSLGYTHTKST